MKLNVSDVKTGNTFQRDVPKDKESLIVGKKVGEKIEGGIIGMAGYTLAITGGSDNAGFPIRPDVPGQKRVKVVIGRGPGVRHTWKGEKRKKIVSGSSISAMTVQVNAKVAEYGPQKLEELGFAPKPKEAKAAEKK